MLAPSSSIWLPSIIEGESARSDPASNSNSGSIASLLQWEQDRNIELIHHMQRVEKRLDDRAEKLGRKEAFLGCPALEFLDDLRFAFGEWLTKVEAKAKASEENLAELDTQWQKLDLAQPPLRLVGNKVCAVLLRKIHSYEEEWHRAFNQGDDLDAVSIPLLSKKDIVEIIRQWPRKHRGIGRRSEHYCTIWLLTNVGRRFLTFHSNQLRLRSTTLGGDHAGRFEL